MASREVDKSDDCFTGFHLAAQKKETPVLNVMEQIKLSSGISELTEEIEDLRSEKAMRLSRMNCSDSSPFSQRSPCQ